MHRALAIIAVGISLLALSVGCGIDELSSDSADTKIPPRAFQFVTVLPLRDNDEAGGWQIACVKALIGQNLPVRPSTKPRRCALQAQVPLRTRKQGTITKRKAQFAAAASANEAVEAILESAATITEATCGDIRRKMKLLLEERIAAAKVTRCIPVKGSGGSVTAPPLTWPTPR